MHVKPRFITPTGVPRHGGTARMIIGTVTGELLVEPAIGKDRRTYLTESLHRAERAYNRLWEATLHSISTHSITLRGYEIVDGVRYWQVWE